MARLHGAIERDPAQHEKLIVRIKEILAQVARCVPGEAGRGRDSGPRCVRPAVPQLRGGCRVGLHSMILLGDHLPGDRPAVAPRTSAGMVGDVLPDPPSRQDPLGGTRTSPQLLRVDPSARVRWVQRLYPNPGICWSS